MNPKIEHDSAETFRALRDTVEITKRMKRLKISVADAIELLGDLLRGFEEYERQQEAEETLAFPTWMYRSPNHSRPETTYVMEEVSE